MACSFTLSVEKTTVVSRCRMSSCLSVTRNLQRVQSVSSPIIQQTTGLPLMIRSISENWVRREQTWEFNLPYIKLQISVNTIFFYLVIPATLNGQILSDVNCQSCLYCFIYALHLCHNTIQKRKAKSSSHYELFPFYFWGENKCCKWYCWCMWRHEITHSFHLFFFTQI